MSQSRAAALTARHTLRLLALSVATSLVLGSHVAGAEQQSDAEPQPLVFTLLTDTVGANGIRVTNGIPAPVQNWSALIIAQFVTGTDAITHKPANASCTATLIGPQTALLAAHCVDKGLFGGVRDVSLKLSGYPAIPMHCEMYDKYASEPYALYSPRSSDDYALCALDQAIPGLPDDFVYESITLDHPLAKSDAIVIAGYGCTRLDWTNGELKGSGDDKTLNIADQAIDRPASGNGDDASYAFIRSALIPDKPKTQARHPPKSADSNPSAICPGDSGGPVMGGITTDPSHQTDPARSVRAINSSIDAVLPGTFTHARANDRIVDVLSRVADLGRPAFRSFLEGWLARHRNVGVVCGYNDTASSGDCR